MKSPTPQVQAAFDHVRSLCPDTIGVLITGNGRWFYYDEWTDAVVFPNSIRVDLLEDAADSVAQGPVAFEVRSDGKLYSP
jgi:hypothetical protein